MLHDDREKRSSTPNYGNKEESSLAIKIIGCCFLIFVGSVIWYHIG